jgi:hypothetical protein
MVCRSGLRSQATMVMIVTAKPLIAAAALAAGIALGLTLWPAPQAPVPTFAERWAPADGLIMPDMTLPDPNRKSDREPCRRPRCVIA